MIAVAVAITFVLGPTALAIWNRVRPTKASRKDSIVRAEFTNATGDPVFDGTLRQGLIVQLEQSPFLTVVSEERIQQTLRLMERPSDARLTSEIALDACRRIGGTIVLGGSIAEIGTQYSLILKGIDCSNGDRDAHHLG